LFNIVRRAVWDFLDRPAPANAALLHPAARDPIRMALRIHHMIAYAPPKTAVHRSPRRPAILALLAPELRALVEEALSLPLTFMNNPMFDDPDTERRLFDEGMAIDPVPADWYHPLSEARTPRAPSRSHCLTPEEERHLFLRYNFARSRAVIAVARFRAHPSRRGAESVACWYGRAKAARDLLARANLALVLAMARRTRDKSVDLGDLISEGNLALLRAIDAFDVDRGFKFSTYACRAIFKAYGRLVARSGRYHALFPIEFDPALEWSNHREVRLEEARQDTLAELRQILRDNRAKLSRAEQTVLQSRFALDSKPLAEAMTLEEVGQIMGVTKECVRQIQNKALAKLRAALEHLALAT
jgi:RNA polymerase primary sigma factor